MGQANNTTTTGERASSDVVAARKRWREAVARSDVVTAAARDAHNDLIVAYWAYAEACGGPEHVPEED